MILLLLCGIFFLMMLFGALIIVLLDRGRMLSKIVVEQLAMITAQNIPLATGVTLAGQGEPGKAGIILRRLGRLLSEGVSLRESIRMGYPGAPGTVRSLVSIGERSGRLAPALRVLSDHLADRRKRLERFVPSGLPYATVILFFMLLVWSGVLILVVPKFRDIFLDFGVALPAFTVFLIDFSIEVAGVAWLIAGVVGLFMVLSLYWAFRPRRPERPRLSSQIADQARWVTPGLRRMQFAEGMRTIASALRLCVGAGMRLDDAARLAADADVNFCLRSRVQHFARMLSGGMPPARAASEAGLGEIMVTALRSATHGGDLDSGLRFVERYYGAIVSRMWIVLRSLSWPAATLIVGALAASIIVGLFLPLVHLIQGVEGVM
jgi:type IV pilus assembly protein PilC